jgi:hypothetical protein
MKHITKDPKHDRDVLLRNKLPEKASGDQVFDLVLRNMFIEGRDIDIIQLVYNYFAAVKLRWPVAWDDKGRGQMLNRTNGVRALLRFFRHAYLKVARPGDMATTQRFLERVFSTIPLRDADFIVENFVPGTGGEARLYRVLRGKERLS